MWNRGRLLLLLCIVWVISYPVQGVIPHEDFEHADEDLYSIVAFLADTKVLCEEALEYTLLGNLTISFDQPIGLVFSEEDLEFSLEKSEELNDKLLYSSDILSELEDKAGSYYYLKDFLYPVKDLGGNVTSFAVSYTHLTLPTN